MVARDRPREIGITRLNLLRGFELRRNDDRVVLPPGAQKLIAFLALARGIVTRVYVAGTLWIDCGQEAANASLRTALWRLKRVPYELVETTATHLSLSAEVAVDLDIVAQSITRMNLNGVCGGEGELESVLVAGELLPDWYDDWLVIERERFRQARLHALEALCDALLDDGRYGKAIDAGLAAVASEPLRESAHRAVMRAHLAEGNPQEALRQYALCRQLLGALDHEPSEDIESLRRRCGGSDAGMTRVG
jgi:DNA-binding SARP family transcriptional activator